MAVPVLTRERAHQIFEKVLKYSTADETEAIISSSTYSLTRFANNTIHQHVAEEGISLSVRAAADQRTARASTNKLDDPSIRQVSESALALARLQPPDPELLPMTNAQTYTGVQRSFEATGELSPKERAEVIGRVVARAERDKLTAAGIFSSGTSSAAILNSRGLDAYHEETVSEFSVTMLDESSSGWAKQTSPDCRQLNSEALAERAARKAFESRQPREVEPGKYTTILEPSAVLDLLGFLVLDFSALAVDEKRSCLTDRVGQKLFEENITIQDDVFHPLQSGSPFDGEGMPRRRVLLVDKGVVKNLVYARRTAHKLRAEPTGHGFPLPNDIGEAPMNLVFQGGKATVDEMIHSTERGFLLTRLWYIREVDPYQKLLTGMTRDGTFWIENGAVRHGVKNLRFNQSVIEMLRQVEMIGPSQRTAGEESFDMVVPAMKVRDFNFSSQTKY